MVRVDIDGADGEVGGGFGTEGLYIGEHTPEIRKTFMLPFDKGGGVGCAEETRLLANARDVEMLSVCH